MATSKPPGLPKGKASSKKAAEDDHRYTMRISRTTVEKLGIKLYDKPSAVVAELIANAYDADAQHVTASIPFSRVLDATHDTPADIVIEDDGHGMTPHEVNRHYLVVGADRRKDPTRGALSRKKKRPVMGRKGIGKLAPFGICRQLEVRSAGGAKTSRGYEVSHLILDYDGINAETDEDYYPSVGQDDGKFDAQPGTRLTLSHFFHRRTPDSDTFHRQLARRFGIGQKDFEVTIRDTSTGTSFKLGELEIDILPGTRVTVDDVPVPRLDDEAKAIMGKDGKPLEPLRATGWIALAKDPYKNEEVAGVRIYARGKIVSTTRDFAIHAGFHGEHNVRSYLVGEITCEWLDLDDGEDLVRSDRQDILWDTPAGQALQSWGQGLIKRVADAGREPLQKKSRDVFFQASNFEKEVEKRFEDQSIRDVAMQIGRMVGGLASRDELSHKPYAVDLRELVFTLAPHKSLVDSLHEIGQSAQTPLAAIAALFTNARVAEVASLGQVARERVGAIQTLEAKIHEEADEAEFQKLLEQTPWLIDPQWTVLSQNESMETLRKAFERWYAKQHGAPVSTSAIQHPEKRPDFVLVAVGRVLEIVELKKPGHGFADKEFESLQDYYDALREFLEKHKEFKEDFDRVHATLICDEVKLSRTPRKTFEAMEDAGALKARKWEEFLRSTKKAHEDFLKVSTKHRKQ